MTIIESFNIKTFDIVNNILYLVYFQTFKMNLREEVCAIKTSLTPATFEIPVPARKVTNNDIYIWVFKLYRQCGILCFVYSILFSVSIHSS
jgi:hypothetical protein